MSLPAVAGDSSALDVVKTAIEAAQFLAIVIGGLWALYVYRTGRRGEATVSIQPTIRIHRGSEGPVLLVALRVANRSGVLFRYETATATLMDASGRTPEGTVILLPFAEQDPFLPVYGEQLEDEDRVLAGELFEMTDDVVLEPGESVDTELAFPLQQDPSTLLAMRIRIQGRERRQQRVWVWSSFFYIDPLDPGPAHHDLDRVEAGDTIGKEAAQ